MVGVVRGERGSGDGVVAVGGTGIAPGSDGFCAVGGAAFMGVVVLFCSGVGYSVTGDSIGDCSVGWCSVVRVFLCGSLPGGSAGGCWGGKEPGSFGMMVL